MRLWVPLAEVHISGFRYGAIVIHIVEEQEKGACARSGWRTIVSGYNEGRVCAVLHMLKVLSVQLCPSGNGTGVRINLQPVGSILQIRYVIFCSINVSGSRAV